MAGQEHEAAARDALRALERAVKGLYDESQDSIDARRLALDVERVGHDLDLLCGPEKGPGKRPMEGVPPRLQVIDDTVYPQDFWMDAEDEGLGGGR